MQNHVRSEIFMTSKCELCDQVQSMTFANVFCFIMGCLELISGLRSVIVKLLIDVALCLLRISHTEALYKQTFDTNAQ